MGLNDPDKFLATKIMEFWKQPRVADMSASGLRGTVRIQRTVPFGIAWFKPNARRR
jgi:hypothetical protein